MRSFRDVEIGGEALKHYQEAYVVRQKLSTAHPEVTRYHADLATTSNQLAALLSQTGKAQAAIRRHEEARDIFDRLNTARALKVLVESP